MTAAVIVPVRADAEGLRVTLASLDGENVVVVVDGPDAAVEAVGHEAGATVVVLAETTGSYAARNAGIEALPASVDIVLFTDAGCVVRPGWVAAHRRALATADLSGGAVDVTHSPRPSPAEWVDRCRNLRQQAYVEQGGYAATCNLAVRRSALDRTRFDGTLLSGGDRDFCRRACAAGAELVYTADAVVEHPARRTAAAVLAKARRVGRGVAALPPGSGGVPAAPRRPHRGLSRQARAAGLGTGPLWSARVAWLDYRRAAVLYQEATRSQRVDGLHVVVLLASRWSSLEQMNTRWRRVVQAWAEHPDVERVTLVDHPRFRPAARRLVQPAASWLPGVDLLDVTVPTPLRPGPFDRVGWWRAGRALRAALPQADRTVVVSTSSVSAPLLPALAGTHTTLAFDVVDVWRNLAVPGDLGARLAHGYRSVVHAQRLTAVSVPLAESVRRWTTTPVTVVPNGVDVDLYRQPQPAPDGLPEQPFAVYVGSLSSRLDLELVGEISTLLEGAVPVVLAGPADSPTATRLSELPVVWLGRVDTTLVPGLLQRAAVGLFPHRHTDVTEASDSMKLLEYAAAGLPVVSTDLPGLPPGAVAATGARAFADAVLAAAAGPRHLEPLPWVRDRDWSVVADRLLTILSGEPAVPWLEDVVR